MSWLKGARLVAEREIAERFQGRLLWVLTVATAALVVGLIAVPGIVARRAKPAVVGLVGQPAQALAPALSAAAAAAHVQLRTVDVPGEAEARSQVATGQLDVALTTSDGQAVAVVKSGPPAVQGLLQATLDQVHQRAALASAGLPEPAIQSALQPVRVSVDVLEPSPPDQSARAVAAIGAGFLLYVSLGLWGSAISNGVAQEKTSRTAEVLLAAVRPSQLLAGKVAGIGLCALLQIGAGVVAGLIANGVAQDTSIPGTVWLLLPELLLWFVLGFGLYALVSAAGGAIVARQEEVQMVGLPFFLPLIASFLLSYSAIATADTWWFRALSFLPPFAPILMPVRLAAGHVAGWEVPLAVAIMMAAIAGVARVASRIYALSLVRGGARLSWGEALRLREA